MGITLALRQTHFVLTLGGTRGEGNCQTLRGFSEFFPNYDKTSAADAFSSCLFIPRMHFETSLIMVSYYGYELQRHRWQVVKPFLSENAIKVKIVDK